jgi:hypothetical protein
MTKAKVIGLAVTGLAVVGGLAIYNYYKKPKATRGKFLSMDGDNFYDVQQSDFSNVDGRTKTTVRANCGRRNADGSFSYYYDNDGVCNAGFKRVAYFGDRNI